MNRYLLIILIFFLFNPLIFSSVFALQQVAGALVINVPIGGSNSVKYGLLNDGNETIKISLRAEGDVVQYLSFLESVDLPPNKIVYTEITVTIPTDYDKSLGGNLTGYLYALQEGNPGQVKINIQMKKIVNIIIPGLPSVIKTTTTKITTTTITNNPKKEVQNSVTGLVVMSSSYLNYPIMIFLILIIAGMGIYIIKIRRR
jgi:hypothetical protein